MDQQRALGLQWQFAGICLVVSLLSSGMVAAGYSLAIALGASPATAQVAGIAAGVAMGSIGSIVGFMFARLIKFRLWEAADMASRIAKGDFSARLPHVSPDDIGWLENQLNEMAGHLERAVGDLQRLAEQNRLLAEEARRGAALEERTRLARDLHDTVNQQLFVLAMRAAAARRKLEKLGGEAAGMSEEMTTLEELSRQAHGEARKLILQLRPTTLEQQGLGPALEEYVKATAAKEGWELTADIDTDIRVSGAVGENLFRVAQEALNNIHKHARAHAVWVSLTREDDDLKLVIRDDGVGFDPKAGFRPTAVGLTGMQERICAMQGVLKVRSAKGKGTELTVQVPMEGGSPA